MTNRICYIYSLSCPKSNEIRYIGKTYSPGNRLATHVYQAKQGRKGYSSNWIRTLLSYNTTPIMSIIAACGEHNWEQVEKKYIKEYRNKGYNLTNILEGGNDGPKPGFKNPNSAKKVKMITLDNILLNTFESVTEAAKSINKNRHVIGAVCRGERPTAYGFKWQYNN